MISGSLSFKWFCSMISKSLCSSGFKGFCSIRFKSFIRKNFKSFCSICFKNFFNMIFRMFCRIFCKIFSIKIFIMALILDPIFFPALATSSKQKIVSPVRRTNFSPRAATHKPVENRVPLGCGAVAAEKAARYTTTTTTTVRELIRYTHMIHPECVCTLFLYQVNVFWLIKQKWVAAKKKQPLLPCTTAPPHHSTGTRLAYHVIIPAIHKVL